MPEGNHSLSLRKSTRFLGVLFCFVLFGFLSVSHAEAKSYTYKAINFDIQVNKDTTVDVTETETFSFEGNFHNAFRMLYLNKVDDITDISVSVRS